MVEGREGISGYERRIVTMDQGLARACRVQMPEKRILGCSTAGEDVLCSSRVIDGRQGDAN